MRITSHAAKRLRQRLGIPKRGAERHAIIAFHNGKFVQFLDEETRVMIDYKGANYVFGMDIERNCPVLVTVLTDDAFEPPWYLKTARCR